MTKILYRWKIRARKEYTKLNRKKQEGMAGTDLCCGTWKDAE